MRDTDSRHDPVTAGQLRTIADIAAALRLPRPAPRTKGEASDWITRHRGRRPGEGC